MRMGLPSSLLEHVAPSRDGGVILECGENGSDELIVAACPDESISYLRVQLFRENEVSTNVMMFLSLTLLSW